MHKQKILVLDIGGTKIHMGLVQQGELLKEIKIPTKAMASGDLILSSILAGMEQLMDPEVVGIGVGIAGLMDEEKGIVYDVTNIPAWKEMPLKATLQGYFKKPVYLTNDANTFILGEKMYGKARNFKNVVGITLGTGFGVGIIINHSLYSGSLSGAGEFGSIPYLDDTFETYCSGKFFLKKWGIPGEDLQAQALQGDRKALLVLEQFGQHVGEAIKLILFALAPDALILGGSVSKGYPFFSASMEKSLQTFPFKRVLDKLTLSCSVNKNAALLGAAALFESRAQAAAQQ